MKSRHEILDEIMFYILERFQCEKEREKHLEHFIEYCKKGYQQAYKKQKGIELTLVRLNKDMRIS